MTDRIEITPTTKERRPVTKHMTGTRKESLAARLELLEAEKAATRLTGC
jgi:predicted dithiol-disulfide oxidoreductase (DUF899 family)